MSSKTKKADAPKKTGKVKTPTPAPKGKAKAAESTRGRKKSEARVKMEAALASAVKQKKKNGVSISDFAAEFATTSLQMLRIAQSMPGVVVKKVDNKNVAFAA